MPKTKKKPLGGKYRFRRFVLTFLLLALVGAGGWFAYERFGSIAIPAILTQDTSSESEPPSEVEQESEPESEPEPEPEPKPEPEPVPDSDWELMLINGSNPIPAGYEPELETITDSHRVDKRIADNVRLMFANAKASGINLNIYSAYRTAERQTENFNNLKQEYIAAGKTEQEAAAITATMIARPGTSEHQTGLALDILGSSYTSLDEGFDKTQAFKWLNDNAHKYGFIMRYPKDKQDITKIIYEPWHYRYVGEKNAAAIKESGLCLEEYLAVKASVPATVLPEEEAEDLDVETDG